MKCITTEQELMVMMSQQLCRVLRWAGFWYKKQPEVTVLVAVSSYGERLDGVSSERSFTKSDPLTQTCC